MNHYLKKPFVAENKVSCAPSDLSIYCKATVDEPATQPKLSVPRFS